MKIYLQMQQFVVLICLLLNVIENGKLVVIMHSAAYNQAREHEIE